MDGQKNANIFLKICFTFSYIRGGPDLMENIRKFYDDNVNGVALSTELMQKAFSMAHPHRRLGFTKDRLYMSSSVFLFRKKSMLTRVFNDEILKLKEFGVKYLFFFPFMIT